MIYSYMDGGKQMTANIANIGSDTNANPLTFGGNGYLGAVDEAAIFKGIMDSGDVINTMNMGLSDALTKGAAVSPLEKAASTWGQMKN